MPAIGWIYYLSTAVFSIVAFCTGMLVARASRSKVVLWTGVVLFLVLAKTTLHLKPSWEAFVFPWTGYVYFQSYWLYPIGLLFFGLVTCQLPMRWNRAIIGLVATGLFGYSLWAERWMIFPPDDSSQQTATADHHCVQTTSHTCVPASCVSLLSFWGVHATEGEMARLCRTRGDGTGTFNAYRGVKLKLLGTPLRVKVIEMDEATFCRLQLPVLFCDWRSHAIVMKYDGQGAIVWDPLSNAVSRTEIEQIRDEIFGAGVVIFPPD